MTKHPFDPTSVADPTRTSTTQAFQHLADYVERFAAAQPEELDALEAEFDVFERNVRAALRAARSDQRAPGAEPGP